MYKVLLADLFVIRRPLLPINQYLSVQQQLTEGQSLESILRTIYGATECQQAIYYASPVLYEQLIDWLDGRSALSHDLGLTLYKYVTRMTTRATPFGMFAGITVSHWKEGEASPIPANLNHRQDIVRLSTDYLHHLFTVISQLPFVRNQLTYKPNSTLWKGGQTLRYIGFAEQDGQLTYYQQETPAHPILEQTLDTARTGASISQLVHGIAQSGISEKDAVDYLESLIINQILVPDLAISLTGNDPFNRLIDSLDAMNDCRILADRLRKVRKILEKGDINDFPQIDQLLALLDLGMSASVQCDTFFDKHLTTLPRSIGEQLNRLFPTLVRLHRPADVTALTEFRHRFFERFGEQPIPLLHALDPESGIGYGNLQILPAPWLSGLSCADPVSLPQSTPPASLPPDVLLRLYAGALQRQETVIRLTTQDIETWLPLPVATSLPHHAYALLALAGQSDTPEPLIQLKGIGGPSATNLLGRFAHLCSKLEDHLRDLTEREQQAYTDFVLAELVHLPESRTGNMLRRPLLRPFEIPILTHSTVPENNQFALNDLLISTPNGRHVVLHTKTSKKAILPRLSTAHYVHTGSLAHYRFLYDLQHQHESLRISWQWGQLVLMPFLPRIQLETIILSRAQWRVPAPSLATFEQWQAWRETYRMCQYVLMGEGDNELAIDTTLPFCLPLMQQLARRLGYVVLFEAPQLNHSDTTSLQWSQEMVIPLETVCPLTRSGNHPRFLSVRAPQRRFFPGSDWTYLKIYAGAGVLDSLLQHEVGELIAGLRREALIDSWFFIRYSDPETHIRLRVHNQPAHISVVIRHVNQWVTNSLLLDNRVYRTQFDTYEREIERYGSETIELCEQWFGTESDFVLRLLALASNNPTDLDRLRMGCLAVQRLLNTWEPEVNKQIVLIEQWRNLFLQEFGGSKSLREELNKQFREYKALLYQPDPQTEPALFSLLSDYEAQAQIFFTHHLAIVGQDVTRSILPSLTHMLINRLFADDQRRHEMVVYHYLHKLLQQWLYSKT